MNGIWKILIIGMNNFLNQTIELIEIVLNLNMCNYKMSFLFKGTKNYIFFVVSSTIILLHDIIEFKLV